MRGKSFAVTMGFMVSVMLLTIFCSLAAYAETATAVVKTIDPEIQQKHEEMLYCTVRVVSQAKDDESSGSSGSGTVLYSKPNAKGEVETFIITCQHVIKGQITITDEWDSTVGREMKKEKRGTVKVEFFHYNHFSTTIGTTGKEADIVAYDANMDVALLKLRDSEQVAEHIALMYPLSAVEDLHTFTELWGIGAAMSHAPIPTVGHLVSMDDEIAGSSYWMSTAAIVFGNSGGAMYILHETTEGAAEGASRMAYHFLGIPARVTVAPMGFSAVIVSHMGYFIPIVSIYEFLDNNIHQFIYDESISSEECAEMRKARDERERQRFVLQARPVE